MDDFYGKELAIGDNVLYWTRYGLKEGTITNFSDKGNLSVRNTRDSSGKVADRVKYVDLRSGKFINPELNRGTYREPDCPHKKQEAGWYKIGTDELIPYDNLRETKSIPDPDWKAGSSSYYRSYQPYVTVNNPDYVPEDQREHRKSIYHDYVHKVTLIGGYATTVLGGKRVVKLES